MEYGVLAVVPPLITILLAVITKEIVSSLFIGTFSGCLIAAYGNPALGFGKMIDITVSQLSDINNIQVMPVTVLIGGLIGLLVRSGGSAAFTGFISARVKSRRGVLVLAWIWELSSFLTTTSVF